MIYFVSPKSSKVIVLRTKNGRILLKNININPKKDNYTNLKKGRDGKWPIVFSDCVCTSNLVVKIYQSSFFVMILDSLFVGNLKSML